MYPNHMFVVKFLSTIKKYNIQQNENQNKIFLSTFCSHHFSGKSKIFCTPETFKFLFVKSLLFETGPTGYFPQRVHPSLRRTLRRRYCRPTPPPPGYIPVALAIILAIRSNR